MGSFFSKGWDPAQQIPDLTGKVAIVTGANAGIGYAITEQLARHGAKIYLATRSESKARAAIEKLYAEIPSLESGKLVWVPLDLSDLDSVAKAADTIRQNETRLDLLINNAGLATESYQTTKNGFEMTVGVNHLGHFLFTLNLLPLLKSTAATPDSDVRIVILSSSAHSMLIPSGMDFQDATTAFHYAGPSSSATHASTRDLFSRYALSKLANILTTTELQRILDAEGPSSSSGSRIVVAAVNPGPVNTEGGMSVFPGWVRPLARMSGLWVPPAQGARPVLFLAADRRVRDSPADFKGRYFSTRPGRSETPSAMARDATLARNLWALSVQAVAAWVTS